MNTDKAKLLRKQLRENAPIRVVGAHDGLSAKLGERAGFDAVWASGFEISASHALPDANILTMTEFLHAATLMNDAVSIPVIADCDTGYGNSNNVIQLVRKYESAGIAAVCIEDKLFPKVNSFIPGRQELASIAEFVGKILAAKNAQSSRDFMVFARVEALIAGWGMDEALTRARAYVEAGADGILIHSKEEQPDQILNFISQWDLPVPLILVPTTYPTLDYETIRGLKKIGVIIYANQGLRSAVTAMQRDLKEIIETGSSAGLEKRIVPMATLFELQGMYEMKRNEEKFLRPARPPVGAVIIASGEHKHTDLMSALLRETPLIQLDINGKTLLERNLEVLSNEGIHDVKVVTGYKGDQVPHDRVKKIENPDYLEANSLHSVMLGLEHCKEATIVLFGDIFFEKSIVHRLLNFPKARDFLLVVDQAHALQGESGKSTPDLVEAQFDPVVGERPFSLDRDNPALKIGKNLASERPLFEFNGIFQLSGKGVEIFRQEYREAEQAYCDRPFYSAPTFLKASVVDFFQYLIEKNYPIFTMEVFGGWHEIHSFANYQNLCRRTSNQ